MPQTLLATLSLALAGTFMLGQSETSMHNVEAVVRDEFELAATGALLHALEFADSRSFDEATTPAALRTRLRLPATMTAAEVEMISADDLIDVRTNELAPVPGVGTNTGAGQILCNVGAPSASPLCNDISDLHNSGWQMLYRDAVAGVTIPIEIRFEVSYVEATNPDVAVNHRTFHKRVDAWARSRDLMRRLPGHEIRLHRVISYDPEVAAEYLRRSIQGVSSECVARRAELQEAASAAAAAAQTAQGAADLAAARAAASRAEANALAATAAQAQSAAQNAAQAVASAQAALAQRQALAAAYFNAAVNAFNAGNWSLAVSYYNTYTSINGSVSSYETAVAQAQATHVAAQAQATSAQAAYSTANAAATGAETAAAAAAASARAAHASAQQAAEAVNALVCS